MEIKDLFREGGCHLAGSPPQTWNTQNPSAIGLGRALHHGEQNLAPCLVEGGARGAGGMQFGGTVCHVFERQLDKGERDQFCLRLSFYWGNPSGKYRKFSCGRGVQLEMNKRKQ